MRSALYILQLTTCGTSVGPSRKFGETVAYTRADSMFAPSQWETKFLCNDVSHWLSAGLIKPQLHEAVNNATAHYTDVTWTSMRSKIPKIEILTVCWPDCTHQQQRQIEILSKVTSNSESISMSKRYHDLILGHSWRAPSINFLYPNRDFCYVYSVI